MASVTVYTADRMQAIENSSVVSGTVDPVTKKLMLTTRGGTVIDGGVIQGAKGDKGDPGAGNVNTVNTKLGPDVVLTPADLGALPATQFATEAQRGIIELATTTEAAALTDPDRGITPFTLAHVKNQRWEKTGSTIAALGNGLFAGQTALLTLASNTFPVEIVWTGSRWEPVSWKLSGSNTQRSAFETSGVCYEGVEWYSTTDKNSKVWSGAIWTLDTAGMTPIVPTNIDATGGTSSIGPQGLVSFNDVAGGIILHGVFSSKYRNYRLMYRITNVTNITLAALMFQYMASGTIAATSYSFASVGLLTSGSDKNTSGSNTWACIVGQVASAYVHAFGRLEISDPFETRNTCIIGEYQGMDSSHTFVSSLAGIHQSNLSCDGVRLTIASPGRLSGTVQVYGYN